MLVVVVVVVVSVVLGEAVLDEVPLLDGVAVLDELVPDVLVVSVVVLVELGPRLVLLVVAGVPVPDDVVVPGDCDIVFGPLPLVEVDDGLVDDEDEDVWAWATPSAATREAAAAMVKLFGSLLMWISCCRVKIRLPGVARYSAPR